jgi:pre-mRNA-splicing factor SYF2
MSPRNKRKTSPSGDVEDASAKRRFVETEISTEDTANEPAPEQTEPAVEDEPSENASDSKADARMARFKALRARQASSKKQNIKDSQQEAQRMATDPNLLNSINRKHAIVSHKLLKAETEAAGEDFERKRAWDWTVEETEKWDKRMAKKEKHRQDVAFQDYTQDSRKTYKRQMRDFKPDLEAYQKQKMEAIEKATANGGLEIIETEDGELVAVDRDGSFYSTADTTNFASAKPDKAGIDRLVADLETAEEQRLKKRQQRMKDRGDDGGDVTYINIKVRSLSCLVFHLLTIYRTNNLTTSSSAFTTNTQPTSGTASNEVRQYDLLGLREHPYELSNWFGLSPAEFDMASLEVLLYLNNKVRSGSISSSTLLYYFRIRSSATFGFSCTYNMVLCEFLDR